MVLVGAQYGHVRRHRLVGHSAATASQLCNTNRWRLHAQNQARAEIARAFCMPASITVTCTVAILSRMRALPSDPRRFACPKILRSAD
jgi:hypothetical protein